MTIDIVRALSPDLFAKNESLQFSVSEVRQYCPVLPSIAAVTFSAERINLSVTLSSLAIACGNEALGQVKTAYDGQFKLWMFVADGHWKETTPRTLYWKLWRCHKELVNAFPEGHVTEEVAFSKNNHLRYAGLIEIKGDNAWMAIEAVRQCASYALILSKRNELPSSDGIRQVFLQAFRCNQRGHDIYVDWTSLAISLCPLGDILMRVSGQFDDREAAVDLIATPVTLQPLCELT